MRTQLDQLLLEMTQAVPEWRTGLPAADVLLLEQRLNGTSLQALAGEFRITKAGVRLRLYGEGHGKVRRGGVLGCLRGMKRRSRGK